MSVVVAVLGGGSVTRRKILPALREAGAMVIVASRRPMDCDLSWFRSYESALEPVADETIPRLAWVANHNAAHCATARLALERGWHVIVEKPVALSADEVGVLAAMAERKDLLLLESLPWLHHPAVAATFAERPVGAALRFTFAALPRDNFRWDPALGGGALNDLGPYIVSAAAALGAWPGGRFEGTARRIGDDAVESWTEVRALVGTSVRLTATMGWREGEPYRNRLVATMADEDGRETHRVEVAPACTVPDHSGYAAVAGVALAACAPDATARRAQHRAAAVRQAVGMDALRAAVEVVHG
ncbi:MAG: Gfo/Idh/MocA family oxidoreductase [bacterium]|nr:Gfo/Idh/MocA family oxidoreductase [bacterium]